MKIRSYKKSDIEKITKLYNETTIKYNWADLNEEQRKVMLFKDLEWANQLFSSNLTLVLEGRSKILGFVMMKKDGYINFVYVDKGELGKGYGKKLLQEAEREARELGLKRTYLHASPYAIKKGIYEKMGYQDLGLEKFYIVKVEFEGHRMEKFLNKNH